MSRRKLTSMTTNSSLLESSGSLKDSGSRSALPMLSEDRRMNLTDIMIWRKFTRNLRQRVQERQDQRRTFCWLNRSMSRDIRPGESPIETEPTYRMQPDLKPSYTECKSLIDEYLKESLDHVIYEDVEYTKLSRMIADEVKMRLKSSVWPQRYKCISYVTLGQKMGQNLRVCSMCAWDPNNDSYISCSYENESLFCVVTVFAVYYE